MNMSPEDARKLALRALWLPTPWEEIRRWGGEDEDVAKPSADEESRVRGVEKVLGLPPLSDEARRMLERCERDAHDMLAVLPRSGRDKNRASGVRHPLSGAELPGPTIDPPQDWPDDDWERWARDGSVTRHWFEMTRHPAWQNVPAPLPGSPPLWAVRSMTAALVGIRAEGDEPAMLLMHLGPVKSFVQDARRTQDMWMGSLLLSFLTYRMIDSIVDELGPQHVVSPHLRDLPLFRWFHREELQAENGAPLKYERVLSVLPNKVVAIVPKGKASDIATEAMAASRDTWLELGGRVKAYLEEAARQLEPSPNCRWDQPFFGFDQQMKAHLDVDALVVDWPRDRGALGKLMDATHAGEDLEQVRQLIRQWDGEDPDRVAFAYGALFDTAHRLFGGARESRAPQQIHGDTRPKCVQCGVREQMGPVAIRGHESQQQRCSRQFWDGLSEHIQAQRGGGDDERHSLDLTEGEGLCAVCLSKRFAGRLYFGDSEHSPLGLDWGNADTDRPLLRFPSLYTIATAPLRCELLQVRRGAKAGVEQRELDAWNRAYEGWKESLHVLHDNEHLNFDPPGLMLGGFREPMGRRLDPLLVHDGMWFYEEAYEPERAFKDHFGRFPDPTKPRDSQIFAAVQQKLPEAREYYRRMRRLVDTPVTDYYAVVRMDGDGMGDWLAGKQGPSFQDVAPGVDQALASMTRPVTPAVHADMSRRLSHLATEVFPGLVDKYLGRLVFSGGDDLLALLPLATVFPFLIEVQQAVRKPEAMSMAFTMSAGVLVSHVRMPFQLALGRARDAEDASKSARRRLRRYYEQSGQRESAPPFVTIEIVPRSGDRTRVTMPWVEVEKRGTLHRGTLTTLMKMAGLGAAASDAPDLAGLAHALRDEMATLTGGKDEQPAPWVMEAVRTRIATLLARRQGDAARDQWMDEVGWLMTTMAQHLVPEPKASEKEDCKGKKKDKPKEPPPLLSPRFLPRAFQDYLLVARFLARETVASELCGEQDGREVRP